MVLLHFDSDNNITGWLEANDLRDMIKQVNLLNDINLTNYDYEVVLEELKSLEPVKPGKYVLDNGFILLVLVE